VRKSIKNSLKKVWAAGDTVIRVVNYPNIENRRFTSLITIGNYRDKKFWLSW
jgi:hypothetical protein